MIVDWYNSLSPVDKSSYIYWTGFTATIVVFVFNSLVVYYKGYLEYVQEQRKHPPKLFLDYDVIEPPTYTVDVLCMWLLVFVAAIVWQVTWIVYFGWRFKKLFTNLVTKGINPLYWIRRYIIAKNKALIVTSTNSEIRALIKSEDK